MKSVQKGVSERYPFQKRCLPYSRTRRVQALLVLEATALVQVVTQQLTLSIRTPEEV